MTGTGTNIGDVGAGAAWLCAGGGQEPAPRLAFAQSAIAIGSGM
jgi:hypothetical protein